MEEREEHMHVKSERLNKIRNTEHAPQEQAKTHVLREESTSSNIWVTNNQILCEREKRANTFIVKFTKTARTKQTDVKPTYRDSVIDTGML